MESIDLDLRRDALTRAYSQAKSLVLRAGFADEVDQAEELSIDDVQECDFLREAAWVILCSGMRERVVRHKFAALSSAFLDWSTAFEIHQNKSFCRSRALQVFAHVGKVDAILDLVAVVAHEGFEEVITALKQQGPAYLNAFSYLGPTTSLHLAKNLGLDVVKPDRHLVRIASLLGYVSPYDMCCVVAEATGDRLSVIDLVFWRFAVLRPDYIAIFSSFRI